VHGTARAVGYPGTVGAITAQQIVTQGAPPLSGRGQQARRAEAEAVVHDTKRWTVVVDIEECDGAIRAIARLHDRTSDRLVGEGVARVGPVELVAPAVGPEVATARALNRLSERLTAAAKHEYDVVLRHGTPSA
jgi:hypothetical protein